MSTAHDDDHSRGALRTLVDTYAIAADTRNDDLFVSLFTPEGLLRIYQEGALLGEFAGSAGLCQATAPLDQYHATMHLVANHTCAVTGNDAQGTTYCNANHLRPSGSGFENLKMTIRYDDRYLRDDEHGWRFTVRDLYILWIEVNPASVETLRF